MCFFQTKNETICYSIILYIYTCIYIYTYIHMEREGEEGSTCKKASFYGKITNLKHHFNDSMILQKIAIV